jgi:hypothetical protein
VWKETFGRTEIWAVPLDERPPKLAVAISKVRAGLSWEGANQLRQLFSPDGSEIVVSGKENDLVRVRLETGRVTPLGVKGWHPTWSRDGNWISFAPVGALMGADAPPNMIIPSAGGTVRTLPAPGEVTEWSSDGHVLLQSKASRVLVHAPTLTTTATLTGPYTSPPNAFWSGRTGLVLTSAYQATGNTYEHRIEFVDPRLQVVRSIASQRATREELQYIDPRVNPATGEILYIEIRSGVWQPRIADQGGIRILPIVTLVATWSPSGDGILFVRRIDENFRELVLTSLDGTVQRVLLRGERSEGMLRLASVRY